MIKTIAIYILLVLVSYLIGNLNFAIFITQKKHNVITKLGSGNPGTMNMFRNFGFKLGLLTLIFDMLKGVTAALLGYFMLGEVGLYIAGLSEVIGHIYPIMHHFKGGKGVASSFGIFIVANPIVASILCVFTIVMVFVIKYGSLCTLSYVLIMGVIELILVSPANWLNYIFISAIVVLIFWAHRSNIKRLLTGKETKTEFRKKADK